MENIITTGRIVLDIAPDTEFTRHSEGDFIRLADGSILFAYSRFTGSENDDAPSDIVGRISRDSGETWSEPQILISAARFGVKNIMSVSFMQMQNGDTGLFYLVKQSPVENRVMLARSKDGLNYYSHIECQNTARAGLYILNNQRAERLSDGRIILPLALHDATMRDGKRTWFNSFGECVCCCSDDDGYTWHTLPGRAHVDFAHSNGGLQEPGIIEKRNGVLWMYSRTDMMYQYECFSFDGGNSWTTPQPSRFTSPQSPMKLARSPYTGDMYAFWNPVPNYNGRHVYDECGGRTPFVWARSADDGATWSAPVTLGGDADRGYCYPAVHFLPDGNALVAYCAGSVADGSCLVRLRITKLKL